MKKHFFTGLIVLLPIAITLGVIVFLLDLLTAPFVGHVEEALRFIESFLPFSFGKHPGLFIFVSRVFVLIGLFLLVLLLGFLGQRLFFNWIVKKTNNIILRIPILKTLYRVVYDIISAIFSERKTFFDKVVLAPFPFLGAKAVALVPGNAPKVMQPKNQDPKKQLKACIVSSVPHPLSGFLLLIEDSLLITLDLNLEEVLKFLVSCGIYQPTPTSEIKEITTDIEQPIIDPDQDEDSNPDGTK